MVPLDVPRSFIENIVEKRFELNRQHDSGEFFLYLLEQLSSELKNINRTDICRNFALYLKQSIKCTNCKHEAEHTDVHFIICLTIGHSTIGKSISQYFKKVIIDDFKCEKCSNIGISQELSLAGQLPKQIYFQFKIFNNFLVKIVQIDFEVEQEIFFFGHQYMLNSIIMHVGSSIQCGHFFAYVRRGKKWYVCDDDKVRIVDIKNINTSNIYMICYENCSLNTQIDPSNNYSI